MQSIKETVFGLLKFTSIILLILCVSACSSDTKKSSKPLEGPLFTKLTSKETGIDFKNTLREDIYSRWNVLSWEYYYNGAGVGLGDINNDGLLDVFLSGNTEGNRLYLNKGDFKFEDITQSAGITHNRFSTGVSMVDINNDGHLDIYVCNAGPDLNPVNRENFLYINQGNNTFKEEAAAFGLNDANFGTQAVFFDMEKDGDLDCYIMNESMYARIQLGLIFEDLKKPGKLEQASGKMYRNDNGKFTDITRASGTLQYGYGLGLAISDFNYDGYPDIYVANDYSVPDMMWINQKNGTFVDEIKDRTKQLSWFSMGVDIADVNNDLHPEIAVVDMATGDHYRGKTLMASMDPELFYTTLNLGYQRQHMFNVFQMNEGDGTFNNVAGLMGVQKTEWSWASLLADYDNDGFKDYYITNGYRRYSRDNDSRIRLRKAREENGGSVPNELRKELFDQIPEVPIENEVYRNVKGQKFENVSKEWGVADKGYSNGAAYGDLDNDGDLDLVVNNIDDLAWVYRNNSVNNYLKVELDCDIPSELTKVIIDTDSGQQMVEHNVIRGYQSSVTPYLHFGLGQDPKVNELTVIWPDDTYEVIKNVKVNQTIKLKKANASGKYERYSAKNKPLFKESNKLNYTHQENEFDDFQKEVLLPYKQSTLGPFISHGDVNGDGLDDVFVGGAKGQSGRLMMQNSDGSFTSKLVGLPAHEDMGSHFFDADGDGDQDLYVVSSGNDLRVDDPLLQDRLYINDGKGNFSLKASALPVIRAGGSRVKSCDIDGDGDLDLFVGGRLVPGNYPNIARSYLLENNGGTFKDVTEAWSTELMNVGLVNDIIWSDLNGDDKQDLILAGEWMSPKFFINEGSSFSDQSSNYVDDGLAGWWFNMEQVDVDSDGDMDIVLGNLGLNSKFSASKKKPFKVFANDFDGNGTCDIVLAKEYKGKTVPVRGRQCSSEQMPFILDKFETYDEFAKASVVDILSEEKINEGVQFTVTNLKSGILLNENGKYSFKALPYEAQSFPIQAIEAYDVNNDGHQDLILTGNIFNMEIETPRLDSGEGLVMINDGQGNFESIKPIVSGFRTSLDSKDMIRIKSADGNDEFVISNNNGPVQTFSVIK